MIVFGESHLRQIFKSDVVYYNEARTHLSLNKDTPTRRPVRRSGSITMRPFLGALHHQYYRIWAFGRHNDRS